MSTLAVWTLSLAGFVAGAGWMYAMWLYLERDSIWYRTNPERFRYSQRHATHRNWVGLLTLTALLVAATALAA